MSLFSYVATVGRWLERFLYLILTRLKLAVLNICLLSVILYGYSKDGRAAAEPGARNLLVGAAAVLIVWSLWKLYKWFPLTANSKSPLADMACRFIGGIKEFLRLKCRRKPEALVRLANQQISSIRFRTFLLSLTALYQMLLWSISPFLHGNATSEAGLAAAMYHAWLLISLNFEGLSFPGHITLLALFVVCAVFILVCSLVFATKRRFDAQLPHHRVQDKNHSLRLKDHVVIFGNSESVRLVLHEAKHQAATRQIVLVSQDLSRDDYAGLTHVYENVWALRGMPMDPDVLALADIKDAKQAVFLTDSPSLLSRLEPETDHNSFIMLRDEMLLGSILSVEGANPKVQSLVEMRGAGPEADLVKAVLGKNDLVLRLDDMKKGVEVIMTMAPRAIELLYDLLSVSDLFGFEQKNNPCMRMRKWKKGETIPAMPFDQGKGKSGRFTLPLGIVARKDGAEGNFQFFPNLPPPGEGKRDPVPLMLRTGLICKDDNWTDAFWVLVKHGAPPFQTFKNGHALGENGTKYLAREDIASIPGRPPSPWALGLPETKRLSNLISWAENGYPPLTPEQRTEGRYPDLLVKHPWLERHLYARLFRAEFRDPEADFSKVDKCRFWREVTIGCPAHLSALLIARCIVEEEPFHLLPKILGILPETYQPDGYTVKIRKYELALSGEYSPESLLQYFAKRSEIPIAIERRLGRLVVGPALFHKKHWDSTHPEDGPSAQAIYVFHMEAPPTRQEGQDQ